MTLKELAPTMTTGREGQASKLQLAEGFRQEIGTGRERRKVRRKRRLGRNRRKNRRKMKKGKTGRKGNLGRGRKRRIRKRG